MVGAELLSSDVDVNIILVKKIMSQLFHLLRLSSGPHENLTVRSNLLEDFPDLGFEAHVEHTVSFVQTQVSDSE